MIGRVGGVVNEAGAAGIDSARDEGEANGALVGDALERANEVGAFKILKIC